MVSAAKAAKDSNWDFILTQFNLTKCFMQINWNGLKRFHDIQCDDTENNDTENNDTPNSC